MADGERTIPRAHAPALRAALDHLSNHARGAIWLVPEAICKVYVLAVYDGRDPFEAIRRFWFGEHIGLHAGLANSSVKAWLRGLQAVSVEIPRASA